MSNGSCYFHIQNQALQVSTLDCSTTNMKILRSSEPSITNYLKRERPIPADNAVWTQKFEAPVQYSMASNVRITVNNEFRGMWKEIRHSLEYYIWILRRHQWCTNNVSEVSRWRERFASWVFAFIRTVTKSAGLFVIMAPLSLCVFVLCMHIRLQWAFY